MANARLANVPGFLLLALPAFPAAAHGAFAGGSRRVSFLAPWGSGVLAVGDAGGALGMARYTY